MSNLFSSSIGRKLVMSLSGLFLIIFLLIHLAINALLLVPDGGEMFNTAANFMALPAIKYGLQPILALGFLFHIAYAAALTARNNKARGKDKYKSGNNTKDVTWMSKNMGILGIVILAFLIVHIYQFFVPLQVTHTAGELPNGGHDVYHLVKGTLSHLPAVICYVIGFLALALHLTHGFWSSFQTLGFNNSIWRKRWTIIGIIYAWFVSLSFCIIAITVYACS